MNRTTLIALLTLSLFCLSSYGQENPDSVYMIAKVKYKMRNMELARENCMKTLELSPNHYQALLLMGLIEYDEGNLEKSLDWMGKSIASYDRFAEAYYERGLILYYEDRMEEAAEDFVKAADIRINNAEYAYFEGMSLLKVGETYNGCKAIKKAGRLGSDENIEAIWEKYDCDNAEKPEEEKLSNKIKNLFKSKDND